MVWLQNGHVILTEELGRPDCNGIDLVVHRGGSTGGFGAVEVALAGKGSSIATATGMLSSNGGAVGVIKLPPFIIIQSSVVSLFSAFAIDT
jgi:hypothetical protein